MKGKHLKMHIICNFNINSQQIYNKPLMHNAQQAQTNSITSSIDSDGC